MAGNPLRGKQKIFILTGNPGCGKSSFLMGLVERVRNMHLHVTGFVAPSILHEDASRSYDFRDLSSGETMPLASRVISEGWLKVGSFYFNPEALRLGNRILMDPDICEFDLVVIDEIGPFELEGRIWADAVNHLLENCKCPMIWTVRKQLIQKVIHMWKLENVEIIDLETHSPDHAAGMILAANKGNGLG